MKKKLLIYIVLGIVVVLPYVGFFLLRNWYNDQLEQSVIPEDLSVEEETLEEPTAEEQKNVTDTATVLVIDKGKMRMTVYNGKGKVLDTFGVACGRNFGDKQKQGDMRTPEGVFTIAGISDASSWSHDFNDGKGVIEGAYGPYFFRLITPGHQGIGIHGTHNPASIGQRVTEGCIRLRNENVKKLRALVKQPSSTLVVIVPSDSDAVANMKPIEEE